jgi:hypothetical protein
MSLGHILQVFIVLLAILASGTCLCAGFFGTDHLDFPVYHRRMDSAEKIHPHLAAKRPGLIAPIIGSLAYERLLKEI